MKKDIKRGQVWYHKPSIDASGHIQRGARPVIIVSNDRLNQSSSVVLAVPCTLQAKRNFPTHAMFIMNNQVSIALTEHVGPVNVDELTTHECTLENFVMDQVDHALLVSFGLREANIGSNNKSAHLSSCCEQDTSIDNIEGPNPATRCSRRCIPGV